MVQRYVGWLRRPGERKRSSSPCGLLTAREGDGSLISRSHHAVACFALAVLPFLLAALATSEARAQTLTPFRYEEQAQRHCPGDSVVWLDFRKRRYYVHGQK